MGGVHKRLFFFFFLVFKIEKKKVKKMGFVFCKRGRVRSGGVGHNIGASCHVTDGHVFFIWTVR